MLSQRTVGRFQRVLNLLFYSRLIYGSPTALTDGEYHNRLYQEGIRPELLDHIGNQYSYGPLPSVRALHEGHAIDWVYRNVDGNLSIPTEVAREMGDTYLLVFAAVALRRYDELSYDYQSLYRSEVQGFLQSLKEDGFSYHSGHIWDSHGHKVTPTPFTQVSKVTPNSTRLAQAQIPTSGSPEKQVPEPGASVHVQRPTTGRKPWSPEAKIAFWGTVALFVVGLAAVVAAIASPEVRRWLGLEKPQAVTAAPSIVSSSAAGTKDQQDVHNEPGKPPDKPIQQKLLQHHVGEGFIQISEEPADHNAVVKEGSPLHFLVSFTNKAQEPANDVVSFAYFMPIGEHSEHPEWTEKDAVKEFHRLRDEQLKQRKKAGYKGAGIGSGETDVSSVGTSVSLKKETVDAFYAKKLKLYVLGWAQWRTLDGQKGETETCRWLEPPDPPQANPPRLFWNVCMH